MPALAPTPARLRCQRCDYQWTARRPDPATCARCRSASWGRPPKGRPFRPPDPDAAAARDWLHCRRCGNDWWPHKAAPRRCPACKSPNWNAAGARSRRHAAGGWEVSYLFRFDLDGVPRSERVSWHVAATLEEARPVAEALCRAGKEDVVIERVLLSRTEPKGD